MLQKAHFPSLHIVYSISNKTKALEMPPVLLSFIFRNNLKSRINLKLNLTKIILGQQVCSTTIALLVENTTEAKKRCFYNTSMK